MKLLDTIQIFSFFLTGVGFLFAIIDAFPTNFKPNMENWTLKLEKRGKKLKGLFGIIIVVAGFFLWFGDSLFPNFFNHYNWQYAFLFIGFSSFSIGLNLYFYLKDTFLPQRPFMALCLAMNALGLWGEVIQVLNILF